MNSEDWVLQYALCVFIRIALLNRTIEYGEQKMQTLRRYLASCSKMYTLVCCVYRWCHGSSISRMRDLRNLWDTSGK
jgi:hypothetical protein